MQYYIRKGNQILGPYSEQEISANIRMRTLSSMDEISTDRVLWCRLGVTDFYRRTSSFVQQSPSNATTPKTKPPHTNSKRFCKKVWCALIASTIFIIAVIYIIGKSYICGNTVTIWYIPGFLSSGNQEVPFNIISNTFPSATIELKSWDNIALWGQACENADKEALTLVKEIERLGKRKSRNLLLIGHSLGGRITIRTLAHLSEKGIRVKGAYILGAAIPYGDDDLSKMGKASKDTIISVCNPNDYTLKVLYRAFGDMGMHNPAYGAVSSSNTLFNVKEISVPKNFTEEVDTNSPIEISETIKEICNHFAVFYLEYMQKIVAGEKLDGTQLMLEDIINIQSPVVDAEIFWNVLDTYNGWKLEQHTFTGHCRILDPQKRRQAWGREDNMRASFEKIKRSNTSEQENFSEVTTSTIQK